MQNLKRLLFPVLLLDTTDDNARALRLCIPFKCHNPDDRMLARVTSYLSFWSMLLVEY